MSIDKTEAIKAIQTLYGLKEADAEKKLSTLSDAEISKLISNYKQDLDMGVSLQKSETCSVFLSDYDNQTYTDNNGNTITEYFDGENVVERIIKDKDGNSTTVTYRNNRPFTQIKNTQGNIEKSKFEYHDDAENPYVTIDTVKADKSTVRTNTYNITENGDIIEDYIKDRKTVKPDGTTVILTPKIIDLKNPTNNKKTFFKGECTEEVVETFKGKKKTTYFEGIGFETQGRKILTQTSDNTVYYNEENMPVYNHKEYVKRQNEELYKNAYEKNLQRSIPLKGTHTNVLSGNNVTLGKAENVTVKDFITNILGIDINSETGKKLADRFVRLPDDALQKISYADYEAQTLGTGKFAPKTNDYSNASFEKIARDLRQKSGVNIETQDEVTQHKIQMTIQENAEKQREERLGLTQKRQTAELLADIAENNANMYENYYHTSSALHKVADLFFGYATGKSDAGVVRKNRELADEWRNAGKNFEDKFKETFGKDYDEKAVKDVLDNVQSYAKAIQKSIKDEFSGKKDEFEKIYGLKYSDEAVRAVSVNFIRDYYSENTDFKMLCQKAFGFSDSAEMKDSIEKSANIDNLGELAIVFATMGQAESLQGVKLFNEGTNILSKGVASNVSRFLGTRAGNIAGFVPKAVNSAVKMDVASYGVNLVNTGDTNSAIQAGISGAEMGAAGAVIGVTAVRGTQILTDKGLDLLISDVRALSRYMKYIPKPSEKTANAVNKLFGKSEEVNAQTFMETVTENQGPSVVAHGTGFIAEVAGFEAYNIIMQNLKNEVDPATGKLPPEWDEVFTANYLQEHFKSELKNLGDCKAVSKFVMFAMGAKNAQKLVLQESLNSSKSLRGMKVREIRAGEQRGYELIKPDGKKIIAADLKEATGYCNYLMQLDMAAEAKNDQNKVGKNNLDSIKTPEQVDALIKKWLKYDDYEIDCNEILFDNIKNLDYENIAEHLQNIKLLIDKDMSQNSAIVTNGYFYSKEGAEAFKWFKEHLSSEKPNQSTISDLNYVLIYFEPKLFKTALERGLLNDAKSINANLNNIIRLASMNDAEYKSYIASVDNEFKNAGGDFNTLKTQTINSFKEIGYQDDLDIVAKNITPENVVAVNKMIEAVKSTGLHFEHTEIKYTILDTTLENVNQRIAMLKKLASSGEYSRKNIAEIIKYINKHNYELANELIKDRDLPISIICQTLISDAVKNGNFDLQTVVNNVKDNPQVKNIKALKQLDNLVPTNTNPTALNPHDIDSASLVFVHMTDYPVKNGKIMSPREETGTIRNTVHFTLNHAVTSHRAGNWDGKKYAIIMPYDTTVKANTKGQFIEGMPDDIYSNGSVTIPEEAVILVHNPELKAGELNISESPDMKGVKIIECSTDPHELVPTVIKKMGYTHLKADSGLGTFEYGNFDGMSVNDSVANYNAWTNFCKTQNIRPMKHRPSPISRASHIIEIVGLISTCGSWQHKGVDYKKILLKNIENIKGWEKQGYKVDLDLDKLYNCIEKSANPDEALMSIEKDLSIHPTNNYEKTPGKLLYANSSSLHENIDYTSHDEYLNMQNNPKRLRDYIKNMSGMKDIPDPTSKTTSQPQADWKKIKIGSEEVEVAVTKNADGVETADFNRARRKNANGEYQEVKLKPENDLLRSEANENEQILLDNITNKKFPAINNSSRNDLKKSYKFYANKHNAEFQNNETEFILYDKNTGKIIRQCKFETETAPAEEHFYIYDETGNLKAKYTLDGDGNIKLPTTEQPQAIKSNGTINGETIKQQTNLFNFDKFKNDGKNITFTDKDNNGNTVTYSREWIHDKDTDTITVKDSATGKVVRTIDKADEYLKLLNELSETVPEDRIKIYLIEAMPLENLRFIINSNKLKSDQNVVDMVTEYKSNWRRFQVYANSGQTVGKLRKGLNKTLKNNVVLEQPIDVVRYDTFDFLNSISYNGTDVSLGSKIKELMRPDVTKNEIDEFLQSLNGPIENPNYVSANLNTATQGYSARPIRVNIHIPENTECLYIDDLVNKDNMQKGFVYQSELVVQKNQLFNITNIQPSSDGKSVIIDMTIINKPEIIE